MSVISFENRVVIVTGAGGALGRTYALDIAKRGGAVIVNDLGGAVEGGTGSHAMADQVVSEIKSAGGRAIANYDSVASAEGARRIAAAALEAFGRVDALINNAGNFRTGLFGDFAEEDRDALFEAHLVGTYNMTRAVWPHMQAQNYGRIVFTSSSAGMLGNVTQSAYGAAKAGITGLMNVLSLEGAPYGIRCNALMPNAVSRMTEKATETIDPNAMNAARALLSAVGNSMDPSFTTGIAVYLASEACASTHSIYSSCGGRIARVFIGVADGWQGSRERPATAEDIAANIEQIRGLSRKFHTPESPSEEFRIVLAQTPPSA